MKNHELMIAEAMKCQKENKEDDYRLKYHAMPPVGLMNDPNGFIEFRGEYHLFFQWHPFAPSHGLKFWGHYKSKDLINWELLPVALAPDQWYETHGCYSGSAVEVEGELKLIYTGNVKDDQGNRETYQCIASSDDGINFQKCLNNPVIRNQPDGYTRHFRDPKVWRHGKQWRMVIGAQTEELQGRALLYQSADLTKWELLSALAGSDINQEGEQIQGGHLGYMWECPDLFSLNGKDVLLISPQGIEPEGELYQNIYQSGYLLGSFDEAKKKLNHGKFIELDRGFDFYAPQTTLDSKGRRILIAWMGLPEEEDHPTKENGWIHAMTIPRVLHVVEDRMIQKPVEEIRAYRRNEISLHDIALDDSELRFDQLSGNVSEISLEIENGNADEFGLKVRCSEDQMEETVITYSFAEGHVILDRNKSGAGYKGMRRCRIEKREKITLNIFLDTSSIEVFVNGGEEVFTARIYPSKESKSVFAFAKGGNMSIKHIQKWDL